MSRLPKRMPVIAQLSLTQRAVSDTLQRLGCRTEIPWICQQCVQRRSVSSGRRRTQTLVVRPTMRRPLLRGVRIRVLSTLDDRQDIPKPRDILPSQEEGRRSHASKRFDHLMDNLQSNIFIVGQRLNDLTGYSGIEALKKDIEQQEIFVQEIRASLQYARDNYTKAISQRSSSQREINELLQRKHAWNPTDLERFTELYRSDHANEQAESAAQSDLIRVEKTAEEAAAQLSKTILARYHEEQIWSDKIRRMSTWGTWGLMGVNVLLFLIFQIGVEPWRRKRLVKGFEEKVREALEKNGPLEERYLKRRSTVEDVAVAKAMIVEIAAEGEQKRSTDEPTLKPPSETVLQEEPGKVVVMDMPIDIAAESPTLAPRTFQLIKESIWDLFSDRQICLRRIDLTNTALEGAAAGLACAGLLVLLLRPR